jgi:heptosyltransferase-2
MKRVARLDCVFFDGYKPCSSHKLRGSICENCNDYKPVNYRVLILKKGAAGEVIRNTPILRKLRALHVNDSIEISWLTDYPDFVPKSFVNRVLKYDWENVQMLLEEEFDLLLNLDKEHHVCALANRIKAKEKKGFLLDKKGKIISANRDAERKWLTGVFDDLMKDNKKHYVEEIFEICGWKWAGEKYILEDYIIPPLSFNKDSNKPLVGLNTGAGSMWPTRIWPENLWAGLISKLIERNYQVLLLGGPEEHDKNMRLAKNTGAYYEGLKNFKEFTGLMSHCDMLVTAVTMTLHIAIGLGKKIILLNNIFNKYEFYLYSLGFIIEPDVPCKACYKKAFDPLCAVPNCMELISVDSVFNKIEYLKKS